MQDILEFYRTHSPLTAPGAFAHLLEGLPADPLALGDIVDGLLMHRQAADYYHVTLGRQQRAEVRLRSVEERLASIEAIDPSPIGDPRPPELRQVGVCRDFAILHVALLRNAGIPARMRVGFARYLDNQRQFIIDHWISEYWDASQGSWVLTDPGIGPVMRELMGLSESLGALRHNPASADLGDYDFYVAGHAWRLAREHVVRPDIFRYGGYWKGMPCIRGNLLHDFQALNKLELGVHDYWDDLSYKKETALTVEDKVLLDRIAGLTLDPDQNFEELTSLFENLPRTGRIRAKLRMLGYLPGGSMTDPDHLQPSGAQRLGEMAKAGLPVKTAVAEKPAVAYVPYDLPEAHPAFQNAFSDPGEMAVSGMGDILVRGARQHNLKNITVRIPRHKLVVVTGVSGSGKSSLAFDTLYAEGQRRYVESLSSFARQFMEQMEKPQVDQISGLSPAIAIEQKALTRNPRSTVGTVTEILDYLRVLYARLGTPHCPQCGRAVQPQSAQQITNQLARLPGGSRFQLLAPVVRNRRGAFTSTLKQALKDGFSRARVDGEIFELSEAIPEIDKHKKHNIELVVDRLVVPQEDALYEEQADFGTRLMDSVETSLRAGRSVVFVDIQRAQVDGSELLVLSEHNACPNCDLSFPKLEPHMFSFNSPLGMCDGCNGLGVQLQVDPSLIIPKPELSLLDGACAWYGVMRKPAHRRWTAHAVEQIAGHYGVDLELSWNELPKSFRDVLLYGSGDEKIRISYRAENGEWSGESNRVTRGIVYHINRLFRQTKSEGSRRYYMQFMSQLPCPKCNGERLNAEARFTTVHGKRLPEITSWSIEALHTWIGDLQASLDDEGRQIGGELVAEIDQRLGFLRNVGLHYLTLDRSAPSLSGGEGQRIRLASQIGSGLVGVMYILDEPSIGLHPRDHRALLDTLIHLRDIGNTVLVVEHDEATMRSADWIIDLGPGPGILGGELVAEGPPEAIIDEPGSLTGRYLSGELSVTAPNGVHRRQAQGWLTVRGASLHNLKEIDAGFPLGVLTCVTGVSGSGKSSLIAQTLYPALTRLLHNAQIAVPGPHERIDGLDQVDKVINITQEPIGRNPRSNPGTYVGVLTLIRDVFAKTPEARALGYKAGRFSFNVKGGRCEECVGYGYKKVEMHFLPDVWVRCKTCEGQRFNRQTLNILYKGKNIADVLDMDVQEALAFFEPYPDIRRILQTLHDVGLDYIKLGQSALTLSGGEAQRVKLSKELSRTATSRTVYILDEPTTGLHFADIQRLLDVLHRLVEAGNTVIVIEHNLDVIRSADWIIDLGPEGGEKGGYIVAEGSPEMVMQTAVSHTGRFLLKK